MKQKKGQPNKPSPGSSAVHFAVFPKLVLPAVGLRHRKNGHFVHRTIQRLRFQGNRMTEAPGVGCSYGSGFRAAKSKNIARAYFLMVRGYEKYTILSDILWLRLFDSPQFLMRTLKN